MSTMYIKKGFTLLETIIYIALFSVLMAGVLETVYVLFLSNAQYSKAIAVQEEATFLNRKLSWALSGATALSAPNPETLIITRPDLGMESPLVVSEHDGQMFIARGSDTPLPITGSQFHVMNTTFMLIPPTSGIPTQLQAKYEIESEPFLFKSYVRL